MMTKPELIHTIGGSAFVFAVAGVLTLLILFIHRRILPRYGIRIGSKGARDGLE